jgi:hypothetical protein
MFRTLSLHEQRHVLAAIPVTAAKQNLNLLQTIKNAFAGHPPPIPV